jgi:hypothetical protein
LDKDDADQELQADVPLVLGRNDLGRRELRPCIAQIAPLPKNHNNEEGTKAALD